MNRFLFVVIMLLLFVVPDISNNNLHHYFAEAKPACTTTEECEIALRTGSKCVNGYCDNPYQYGCLRSRKRREEEDDEKGYHQSQNQTNTYRMRVCHSEDPPNAAQLGLCRDPNESGLNYPEIRIMGQNWESPFFEAWILQILLSEILDVPTTIETGMEGMNVNFYDPQLRMEYGVSYDMEGLERASHVKNGDCRNVQQVEGEPYKGCGHAILEIWSGQEDRIQNLLAKGAVEPKSFIGVIGQEGWHMPKYTADKDPTLLSHFGLKGDENRRKLAERFLFPTTWGDYCSEVALDGCLGAGDGDDDYNSNNDTTTVFAVRPPATQEESDSYFVEGLYTGHFRKTELSDCDKWPTNCTGHFIDYPCGWTSFFIQQAHHLNIGLQSTGNQPGSNGYTYAHMVEIWYAANWTRSDVIGWWWRPEALYQRFQGTDFELQSVTLPPTNYKCVENRMDIEERCGNDDALRVGDPQGACDVPPIPNFKLLSTGLYKLVYDNPETPEALHSPAYDVMKEFTIDGFSLGQIFAYWLSSEGIDRYGYDPRDAVCRWVSENLDDLQRFIPRSYPREVREEAEHDVTTSIAIGLGAIAVISTLVTLVMTYRRRRRRVFIFAQVEFVFLLLVGMLLISVAAIIAVIPPTNARCAATVWLLNLGYTLELVPLVVKIAAINRLMQAARRMKRIKLGRTFLFGVVAALMAIVVVYMILWTVLDPPRRQGSYDLAGQETFDGNTIISLSYFCESESNVWMIVAVGTQALMLLSASILAFLTRKIRGDVNEASTISFLIYWNFVCVLLRVIVLMLGGSIDSVVLNRSLSIILSADSIATILIYFIPKFWTKQRTNLLTSFTEANFISVGLPQLMRSDVEDTAPSERSNNDSRQSIALPHQSSFDSPTPCHKRKTSKVSFAGDISYANDTGPPSGSNWSHRHDNDDSNGRCDDDHLLDNREIDDSLMARNDDNSLEHEDSVVENSLEGNESDASLLPRNNNSTQNNSTQNSSTRKRDSAGTSSTTSSDERDV